MKSKNKYKKTNLFINISLIFFIALSISFSTYYIIDITKDKNNNQDEVISEERINFKLNGDKEIIIYIGNKFKDPGFKAESNINGDVSKYVEIDGEVNTKVPKTYKITYTLNYRGATSKRTRKVIVKEKDDNEELPSSTENDELVLSLKGSSNITILKDSKYQDKGATAVSKKGKTLSNKIKVNGEVNTKTIGTYKITYSIVDSKKRTVELTRVVNVIDIPATITSSTEAYTNESITLNITVNDNKFSHIELQNGQIVTTNNYIYKVSENGTYSFDIYNTDDLVKKYTYEVKNIDREKPTASCEVIQNGSVTQLKLNAKDNVGIKSYVYNNNAYTTNTINVNGIVTSAVVTVYDHANNQTQVTCKSKKPIINKISKNGVIITVESTKASSDISGYYFSYNNIRPDKSTGGYIATSLNKIDVVRLAGTTYVWVEDKHGNISDPKTITIDNSALLLTRESKYKKIENISLETYLKNKGWSLTELNKLIIRSARAAGLYSQEAAATSAIALQTVLAQKYNAKLPYWWGGKSWEIGANKSWGIYRETYSEEYDVNYYYYGLDCSGFTTWAYVNAGYNIKKGQYPSYWSNTTNLTKDNGQIGDFLVEKGHVTIIVGKTNEGYIKAEAAGKGPGMVLTLHPYTKTSGYYITKGSTISSKYPKMDKASYPSGF